MNLASFAIMRQVSSSSPKRRRIRFERDKVALLETNVDDATGEVISRAVDRLMEEGAFDVTVASFAGKKGRVGQTVRVTCSPSSVEKTAQILVEETGTLGVKTTEYERLIVPRKVHSIPFQLSGFKGRVHVKVASMNDAVRIKPEYSEAEKISKETGVTLREVLHLIVKSAEKNLKK
jgi:pyridinium-3,5-bisthiocarboxylic acid mononucleotide nickel chelatase